MSALRLKPQTVGIGFSRGVRLALVLVAAVAAAQLVLRTSGTGDYSVHAPVAGDNAGPAINALIHGRLSSFVSEQPLMGLTSILLRAPFAALAALLGGGSLLAYGLGAIMCLLPTIVLAAWGLARRGISTEQRFAAAIAAAIMLVGPATAESVHIGHPEEVLAATLATGAVLAALRGRAGWTWLLLGLAAGTKQWALLAAPCALLALPERRLATAIRAGALALALTAALPLADPAAFARADSVVGGISFADPFSLWWPLGSPIPTPAHAAFAPTAHLLPFGLPRSSAAALALVLVLGAMWLYWSGRRNSRSAGVDALALLALCGLARCVTDPDPLQYNFVALLIPLAVWETVEARRLPVLTALATGAVALLARGPVALDAGSGLRMPPALLSALSVAWSLALGCYLARQVVRCRPRELVCPAQIAAAPMRAGV